MPTTYDYGHLLVVNAHSFTDCPEIQKLTQSADVKPLNMFITEDQDGQLLYEVLSLALKQLSLMPMSNHFRLYRLAGTPTSTAYRARDDFIRALTLTREDFFNLMAGAFLIETLDQIEALLQRFTQILDRTGAATTEFVTSVGPINQSVAAIRHAHYDHTLKRLGVCLANQW